MTESITGNAPVTVQIDLHRFVGEAFGWDEDGEPMYPTDNIVGQVAATIAKDVRKEVLAQVKVAIEDQVADIVQDTLAGEIRKTNTYGELTGQTTTLREEIAAAAQKFLTKQADPYSTQKGTLLQQFIAKEVDTVFKREMQAEIDKAKKDVLALVNQQAAAVITDTVARVAGVR